MSINNKVREQISNCIEAAVAKCGWSVPKYIIEIPRDKENGDFSANAAMLMAKEAKCAPRAVAEKLVENMVTDGTYINEVKVAGPGFLNFYLSDNRLYDVIDEVEQKGERYGSVEVGNGKKVMVEFVSANPTGPMHMGNARGGALGDSMAAVLDFAGYDVTREFYLNDAGNQIEKFAQSLQARYLQQCGIDVPFSEEWYQGDDIKQRAAEFIEKYGDSYVNKDEEERKKALVEFSLVINEKNMIETLKKYRINYDVWFKESSLYKDGDIEETLKILKDSGRCYEKDGALWLKNPDDDEKDEVLVRANGIPTYFTADIAYHRNKFVKRGFDKVIDVWGADHHGHVARMKSAMDAVGVGGEKLHVVLMQLVRLVRNGEVARMSKRSGKAITLDVLLDDIGIDAARFFFNMRNAGSHFEFDLDLAVQQSNDNPVYYVQYAHARICSIIRLLAEGGTVVPAARDTKKELLCSQEEHELLNKIAQFPDEITAAADTLEPARLTRYASELATAFHSFYNACRVNIDDEDLKKARLKLIDSARITLANVLRLLAVSAPEKM